MFKSHSAFVFSLVIFIGTSLRAQQTSVSPYSRFGVGEMVQPNYVRALTMGGASLADRNEFSINLANPASYSNLGLTTFAAGFTAQGIRQEQQNPDISIENGSAGLRYLAVGVPLLDWWGSAIGFQPYSVKGYSIATQRVLLDSITVDDAFQGSGGLNRFYFGNAFQVAEGLSLGANVNYIFGNLQELDILLFDNSFLNTRIEDNLRLRGFQFDFGAQYAYEFESGLELSTGITFANAANLKADRERFSFVFTDANQSVDSLAGQASTEAEVTLPSELGFGLSIGRRVAAQNYTYGWWLGADYEIYNGSEFQNFDGQNPLQNGWRADLGGAVVPALAFSNLERSTNYLAAIEYRLGGYYEETPLALNGTTIPNYGISFGLGLPVRQRSPAPGEVKVSNIHTGVLLGRRGTFENGLIRESYLQFYLGISLCDKWFIKYKYR